MCTLRDLWSHGTRNEFQVLHCINRNSNTHTYMHTCTYTLVHCGKQSWTFLRVRIPTHSVSSLWQKWLTFCKGNFRVMAGTCIWTRSSHRRPRNGISLRNQQLKEKTDPHKGPRFGRGLRKCAHTTKVSSR